MGDVIFFSPRAEVSARQNLHNFIAYCRDELTLYEGQGGFSVNSWRYDHKGRPVAMVFAKYSENSNPYSFDPLEEPFLSFAKAYIRYEQSLNEVSSVGNKLMALRMVHDALLEVHGAADPLKIDGLVQIKVRELLDQRYPGAARLFQCGGQLKVLYKFLVDKAITPTLPQWKNPWKRPTEKATRTDEASRKWQEVRCPSIHQMFSLADCFAKAETTKDRYWASVLALLMFAPSRGGELQELTVNSLYEEEGRLAVIWFGEKGFGETLKWVPSGMESVVREAFNRLIEIGRPAREAAKLAYDHPGVFPRHERCITPQDFKEAMPLSALQFAYALNFSQHVKNKVKGISERGDPNSDSAWSPLGFNTKWLKDVRKGGNPSYAKLANYFAKKYRSESWPYLPKTDHYVWDSLLLVREYELHDEFAPRPLSWVIPNLNALNDQLSSRPLKNPIPTIFQRFGFKDEDGSNIRLTSHQLRVWLSTNAERGGMDSWRLAQWAGRARIEDNRAYDLRTQAERETQVREILKLEERPSALQAIKLNLPVAYADLGLNRIGIADVTEYGMCTHDYAMSPCTKGGECMTCKEHVCIKGMPKTLERIKRLEEQLAAQLEKAEDASNDGTYGADRWSTHFGWKLAHVRTQRVRLESEATPDGAVLWIPPEHDPSPVKRALDQQGHQSKPKQENLVDESVIAGLLGGD
jgi:hypothetical protein